VIEFHHGRSTPGRRVEREDLSRRKHTRLLEGLEEEQTCKKTFLSKFIRKPKPGASSNLLEGGVRKDSGTMDLAGDIKFWNSI
jgi:hypothetical protein